MYRKTTIDLLTKYDIPQVTVCICANCSRSQVSDFCRGARLGDDTEGRIAETVNNIVRVINRAAPLRPDLSNGEYMKQLIRSWREEGCFVVLISDSPTRFFCRKENGAVRSTPFMLQATSLSCEVAHDIVSRLPGSIVLESPYASIDQRYDSLQDVWPDAAEQSNAA